MVLLTEKVKSQIAKAIAKEISDRMKQDVQD
jgi:hypothetical protein